MATRSYRIGTLQGVNNRVEQTELEATVRGGGKLQSLSAGENIDINDAGGVRRRRGYASSIAGAAHSLWGDGAEGFAVVGGNLVRLLPSGAGLASSVLRAVAQHLPMSFERFPDGGVIYSNGDVLGRVLNGADGPVVTDPLGSAPIISAIAGALAAGRYTVAVTAMGATESAATPPYQLDVPLNGGVRVAGLPGTPVRIYMTGPNGDIPTLEVETSAASADILTHAASGIRCQTLLLASMPPGSIVRHYNGSLLVAAGQILYRSEPYYYGVFDPTKGYIPFPAPITVVQPTKGGVYVVADQTYWLPGAIDTTEPTPILPYGAVPGTGGYHEATKTVFWLSERGVVLADQSGAAKNLQEDALALPGGRRGATLYRERNGARHIVSALEGAEPMDAAGTGWRAAEITRKETIA